MNRITINGVTIEVPTNMSVNITGEFVSINHVASKSVDPLPVIVQTQVESVETHTFLPDNTRAIVVRFLRHNKGRGYSIGISTHLKSVMKLEHFPVSHGIELKALLRRMVDDGTLTYLKVGKGYSLYGLASMHEKKSTKINDHQSTFPPYKEVSHDSQ
jgi:hypothetical protein